MDCAAGDDRFGGLAGAVVFSAVRNRAAAVSSATRIKVLALSPIPEEGAGCRFRVAQYMPHLCSAGIDVTIRPFYTPEFFNIVYTPRNYLRKAVGFVLLALRRLRQLSEIRDYDVVWLYREAIPLGPPLVERAIAGRGIPIVLDFDDAIFMGDVSEANRAIGFLKNPGRVAEVIAKSTTTVVGNEFLAGYARRFSRHVAVIPTVVDTDRFVPRADHGRVAPGGPVVGWIGSPTTYHYVEEIAGLLRAAASRHAFTLIISGAGKPVQLDGVPARVAPWSLAQEVELFNSCDIGIYPLSDDDWSRGKCGFKAIQFMACGVPVVASAVGVNLEIIRDGENGFLASTPAEWAEKLERLLTDPALRARFAEAGRSTIETRYSLKVTAPLVERILRDAAASRP